MMMKKLAIITTHPIQYNAPLFEMLSKSDKITIKVFYTWGDTVLEEKYDPGFRKVINWDIPLLNGYDYHFCKNVSTDIGSHHFNGIINPDLIDDINAFLPDAILVYGWAFQSHFKIMRHFKNKVPIFFRGDSTLLDKTSFIASLKRKLVLKFVYRFVDYALYVGTNNYNYFKKFGLKDNQLIFAPHVVDNQRFSYKNEENPNENLDFKKQLNIDSSHIVFLFAGKLEPKKNPQLLLKAFAELELGEQYHLVMIGNGILESSLKHEFKDIQTVHFADFQNQASMPAVYEMADVFVLPSAGPGETWGLAINEAMANGTAIIASDKCGAAIDLVHPNENGFVFASNDIEKLKSYLSYFKKNTKMLDSMKLNSTKIIEDYTLQKLSKTIEDIVLTKS